MADREERCPVGGGSAPDDARGDGTKANLQPGLPRNWYHRNPCCRCSLCRSRACFVHYGDGALAEVHICWRGCDGLPPSLLAGAA